MDLIEALFKIRLGQDFGQFCGESKVNLPVDIGELLLEPKFPSREEITALAAHDDYLCLFTFFLALSQELKCLTKQIGVVAAAKTLVRGDDEKKHPVVLHIVA